MKMNLLLMAVSALALSACVTTPATPDRMSKAPPFVLAYKKRVNERIGAVWFWKIRAVHDLVTPGSVHFRYTIDRDGRPQIQRVRTKDGMNYLGVRVSQQAILEAPLPKPPPEVWTWAGERPVQLDLTFYYYDNDRGRR